jgi:hypothetical protein
MRYVAIMIAATDPDSDQRHVGIAYRVDESSSARWLHLAFHLDLRHEHSVPIKYFWIDPSIVSERLRQVAGICVDIAEANATGDIPYSFGSPNDAFDLENRKFLFGPSKSGLTCASFVLAVFDCAKLQLVAYSGWPKPDEDDVRWQQSILKILKEKERQGKASPEHIAAVEREIGNSVRYRPEQVAGAAAIRSRRPVNYRMAKAVGSDVVRFLRGENISHSTTFCLLDRFWRFLGLG